MMLIINRKMSWAFQTIICHILLYKTTEIILQNECFNAIGVAFLIAQGCQTIVQATLG